jgi:hypothetical protein
MAQRKLLDDPERRSARLRELLDRLYAGKHVQNRDITKLLTEQQWQALERELNEARRSQPVVEGSLDYPSELDGYFKLVDEATRRYALGERQVGKPASSVHHREAETLCERAQEKLEELLGAASQIKHAAMLYWLDRPLIYSETGALDLGSTPSVMPRKIGSRSRHTLIHELPNKATSYDMLRHVKQTHLSKALDELDGGLFGGLDQDAMAKLRQLKNLVRR